MISKWLTGIAGVGLALAGILQLAAQTMTSGRYPLQTAAVATALQGAGLHVSAERVRLPSSLSAGSASPALEITAAELLPGGALRVRMACKAAGECLPFFALVEASTSGAGLAEMAALHMSPSASSVASSALAPAAPPMETTVRAGVHTTLLMEDAHMRISLPVITLDSGAIGSEVRVSSLDRKTTYRGVIEGPQMVRGALP